MWGRVIVQRMSPGRKIHKVIILKPIGKGTETQLLQVVGIFVGPAQQLLTERDGGHDESERLSLVVTVCVPCDLNRWN